MSCSMSYDDSWWKKRFKLSSKNSGLHTDPWSSDSAGMMKIFEIDIYDII